MAKKCDVPRTFNIAVVGLSGTEKEKGSTGVGKSCLCNRFVRHLADDYYVDHISVLSQTDFSGRVVNNDHFLYWGEVTKTSDEGVDFHFNVVEQTEFIDDSSFQPFKSGKTDPYYKRCSTTKLTSAEKLMYICKNQLGIEKEYEQKMIPEGKLNIDGFVCVFDVSNVPGRTIEKQVEFTSLILNNLWKTKKPIVLVTTKNDEARESYIKEAERLVTRKEYKGNIPTIETSSHENVNVDLAFFVLAQMIDRTKGKSKVVPFIEAAQRRKEVLDVATEAYQSVIRAQVTDYKAVWSNVSKRFAQNSDFLHYCDLFGHGDAQKMFMRHVKKLKEEYIRRKMQMYIKILPEVLSELLPDLQSLGDGDWRNVRVKIQQHPDFSQYFLESPDEHSWQESDLVDSTETRIPQDILDTSEAETCFQEHKASLEADEKRKEMRKQFKQLLEETGYVTPGKTLSEVRVLFMGRECFEALSESNLQEIYDEHQKEITERAKQNFQELLLENAEIFYHFTSIGPGSVITQEDISKITETLREDSRYKALDRLDQERMLMLLRHLGFVHGPIKEHCPAFPNCMDNLIEKVIAQKAHRPSSWSRNSQWLLESENNQLNLVLLGSGGIADELANTIRAYCTDDIFEMEKIQYTLDFRIIDGDVGLPHNSFRTSAFLPHGCFCVYSNHQTLEYIRESLEKTLLSNLEQEDRLPFHGLPIVILFAADASINEKDLTFLREEGQNRAKSLQCPFIDVSNSASDTEERFDEPKLLKALHSLIESIQRRADLLQIYHTLPEQAANPDIRIIMCMLCGDPYTVEHVLGPLLSHQCCFFSSPYTITLETYLGDCKRSVEVRVTSYHGANAFREELVHGFILVYSTKRKASLSTLSAFSMNIPNIPVQILAVTETGSANAFFSSDLSHQLITEGNAIADKLQAHFMTSVSTCQQKTAFYTPFFKEVSERKPQIEKAFSMDDSDYSLESFTPVPPPVPSRQESYHIRSGSLEDGVDSEGVYEQLPMDSGHGHEDETISPTSYLDDPPLSPSDESDLYTNVCNQENGEHLVKPSQLKNRRSFQAVSPLYLVAGIMGYSFESWIDNRIFEQELRAREWLDNEVYHTYHSRHHKTPPPLKPKPGKQKPGKLNLQQFNNITDAIAKFNLTAQRGGSSHTKVGMLPAPLATPESIDLASDYAQVKDTVPLCATDSSEYAYAVVHNALPDSKPHRVRSLGRRHGNKEAFERAGSDSDSDWSSLERMHRDVHSRVNRKSTPYKKMRKKRGVPVAPPRVPSFEGPAPPLPPLPGGERMMGTKSLNPLNKVRGRGGKSPSDDSDLSDDEEPFFKSTPRPKYKHKRSFRSRRRKQQLQALQQSQLLPQQQQPPYLAGSLQFSALTPDSDIFSLSSKLKIESSLCMPPPDENSGYELVSPKDPAVMMRKSGMIKDGEKTSRKKDKKLREDEKLEKRRLKEEKRLTEKKKKKTAQGKGGNVNQTIQGLESFAQSEDNQIPLFVEKCIRFIEEEGLDSEGIYRVPGNRAHMDQLYQKFDEDPQVSIRDLDIPVNAVATALKDFFSKRLPPLFSVSVMEELSEISSMYYFVTDVQDRSCRLFALRDLLKKIPRANFEVLKFVFQHFVRVAENCRLNSMDSKNLAICWWPTLLPLEFNDMGMFERMRPHLEDLVQTMIDQFRFLFCGEEEVVMV
ncbi:rho GTPase-activating protein 190-like isoform X14 [Limulus polyphemus]|uniref:Rho GTPase-activating protein 190-like isoform X14 n=1 Tax=Limulus polyphemus TaxID=6850 RepID=A0ABM1SK31_LIMPO|nr:rho GTPase-activating protein 190-like isoform X14 [Limulus polyphemus]